jgi:thiamine-monophosphate kinase
MQNDGVRHSGFGVRDLEDRTPSDTGRAPSRELPIPGSVVGDLTERDLIARIAARLPPTPPWMVVGIGDDAAVVEPARNRLDVLSVDALVDGVHFDRAFTPPAAIGHRALAANLSDLAAMGAEPRLALLSLALPQALAVADFDAFVCGLVALAARYRVHVAGGNLTRTPGPLVVNITVVGTVKRRRALLRSGARPGDVLYVSGTIGAAAAGLQMLRAGRGKLSTGQLSVSSVVESLDFVADSCIQRYLYPDPRVRLGSILGRNRAASACMDLSDGLADAVRQVAEASGVGAVIDALPIDPEARRWFESRGADPLHEAITGGDDYELLAAVRPRTRSRLAAAHRHGGVPLTRIGVCTKDPGVVIRRAPGDDRPMPPGYSHFR